MRPLILISNDDGVLSPGLKAVAEAVAPLGDLLIVAPRLQQTSMGRAMPVGPDVGIIETLSIDINGTPHPAYGVHGSPAQSVRAAILEIASRRPDLCVSGINYGENLGASITISGTVGVTLEASAWGVPGLAMSLETNIAAHHDETYPPENWEVAGYFAHSFAAQMLQHPLPPEIAMLNVNVPTGATPQTEARVTRLSLYSYFLAMAEKGRDFSQGYRYSYKVNVEQSQVEPNSDIYAFVYDRVVSVTPISPDMTARVSIEDWYKQFRA